MALLLHFELLALAQTLIIHTRTKCEYICIMYDNMKVRLEFSTQGPLRTFLPGFLDLLSRPFFFFLSQLCAVIPLSQFRLFMVGDANPSWQIGKRALRHGIWSSSTSRAWTNGVFLWYEFRAHTKYREITVFLKKQKKTCLLKQ